MNGHTVCNPKYVILNIAHQWSVFFLLVCHCEHLGFMKTNILDQIYKWPNNYTCYFLLIIFFARNKVAWNPVGTGCKLTHYLFWIGITVQTWRIPNLVKKLHKLFYLFFFPGWTRTAWRIWSRRSSRTYCKAFISTTTFWWCFQIPPIY